MNDYTNQMNAEIEIDIKHIFRAVMNRAWLVILVAVLCAALVLVGTLCLVTPKYEASTMFYVNNSTKAGGDSQGISSGDLSTSRSLVDSYLVILNTRETINDVIDYAGVSRSFREVKDMISAGAVNGTEIIKVTVTSTDPSEAEKLANAVAYIMPQRISTIIEGASTKVVDFAVMPTSPSSPSYPKNGVLGFLIGFVLSIGLIVLQVIFDTIIRTEEDVTECCKHPILTTVPDMAGLGKGGGKSHLKQGAMLGDNISFNASEAYKLLRTKLQFSFADENACHVIGVSSALSGEGKSLTAINLAYTLSQLNKKVILIDCDMRRPTLAEKLRINKRPGLSGFLVGQCSLEGLIQPCNLKNEENAFHVITAGQNPPKPVELLSSVRMEKLLAALRKSYDYVIIDLPPVGEVTDAMAVAKKTDGMLLVVRQNYCDRMVFADAVRQFEFIDTRILGVVLNGTDEGAGKYGNRRYKRYYKRHGNRYVSSYEYNDRSVAESAKRSGKA